MDHQKRINKSGGVTLPSALRRELALESGERMAVKVNPQGEIVLTRIHGTCVMCGGHEVLGKLSGKFICQECVNSIIERNLGGKLFNGNGM